MHNPIRAEKETQHNFCDHFLTIFFKTPRKIGAAAKYAEGGRAVQRTLSEAKRSATSNNERAVRRVENSFSHQIATHFPLKIDIKTITTMHNPMQAEKETQYKTSDHFLTIFFETPRKNR